MPPPDFLSPENRPKLIGLSIAFAVAIGMIVYNFSKNVPLSIATGIFLVVADILVLKMWLDKDDK